MQLANIMLSLGGDDGTTVPKYGVTPSEIAVLRLIHGADAVKDIEPTSEIERAHRDEIARLTERYGRARIEDENGEKIPVVKQLFPGAAARTFTTLEELDIPEEFYKAEKRVKPTQKSKASPPSEKTVDEMTKGELVDYAEAKDIEIDASAKKAVILAAIKAAEEGGDLGAVDADTTEPVDEDIFG
ncbi:hypothetical protein [Nitratireductor soli]|uniref:hypothetical protein n=1 Tax=Nitratireductor soli TaxID=1670619 RepID=UPI000A7524F0|nr:hypothetical protein [Nitratireductor soli]